MATPAYEKKDTHQKIRLQFFRRISRGELVVRNQVSQFTAMIKLGSRSSKPAKSLASRELSCQATPFEIYVWNSKIMALTRQLPSQTSKGWEEHWLQATEMSRWTVPTAGFTCD